MKKIFLPLGLLALIAAPSAGSAKLVLDMPPILAGKIAALCNSCNPCDPSCTNPCTSCTTTCCGTTCMDNNSSCTNCCSNVCQTTTCGGGCNNCNACDPSCTNPCTTCASCCGTTCMDNNTSCITCCDNICKATATCPAGCTSNADCSGSTPNCCNSACQQSACNVVQTAELNDTGITAPTGGGQDADFGRDKTHNDPADGLAGFSFTKLDSAGNALAASATSWACVKDNVTGLIWEDKASWSRTAKADAAAPAVTCGSASAWHLPTVKELMSIVSYHAATRSVGNSTNTFFRLPDLLGTGDGVFFWTDTTSKLTGYYWGIAFEGGRLDYTVSFAYPRFVKGTLAPNLVAGTDVVIDKNFKLVWKKCLEGYSGASCAADGTKTIFTWQEALTRAGENISGGWRLPNIKELQSIVDETKSQPAINATLFPGTPNPSNVWSSSPAAGVSGGAWYTGFHGAAINGTGYGEVLYSSDASISPVKTTASLNVRLVRDCTAADTACYN